MLERPPTGAVLRVAPSRPTSFRILVSRSPGEGWSSHVAELRVLVARHARSQGLGRSLARAALVEAQQLGCTQAYVEVVAEQDALVAMFQDMGFLPEALLADFVRDSEGVFHDLMILTHKASEHWSRTHLLADDEVEA